MFDLLCIRHVFAKNFAFIAIIRLVRSPYCQYIKKRSLKLKFKINNHWNCYCSPHPHHNTCCLSAKDKKQKCTNLFHSSIPVHFIRTTNKYYLIHKICLSISAAGYYSPYLLIIRDYSILKKTL